MYLQVAAYLSILAFSAGVLYKVFRWSRMPFHLRWDIQPVPHDPAHATGGSSLQFEKWWEKPGKPDAANELKELLLEMLFIKRAFKQDKGFWLATYLFHGGTYLMLLWAALLAVWAAAAPPVVPQLAEGAGWLGISCMALGSISLLGIRAGGSSRRYTTPAEFLNLAFVIALPLTGFYAWSADPGFGAAEMFVASLVSPATHVALSSAMVLNLALIAVFLAYLPFTKMTHFVGKYFTYHRVIWEDAPLSERDAEVVQKYLGAPISWSAPHILKGRSWVDNVKEVPGS